MEEQKNIEILEEAAMPEAPTMSAKQKQEIRTAIKQQVSMWKEQADFKEAQTRNIRAEIDLHKVQEEYAEVFKEEIEAQEQAAKVEEFAEKLKK